PRGAHDARASAHPLRGHRGREPAPRRLGGPPARRLARARGPDARGAGAGHAPRRPRGGRTRPDRPVPGGARGGTPPGRRAAVRGRRRPGPHAREPARRARRPPVPARPRPRARAGRPALPPLPVPVPRPRRRARGRPVRRPPRPRPGRARRRRRARARRGAAPARRAGPLRAAALARRLIFHGPRPAAAPARRVMLAAHRAPARRHDVGRRDLRRREDAITAPATTRPPALVRAARTPSTVDLDRWDPEDESRWDRRFAWRTLWITTYNLTLAFCAWYLVSAVAPRLNDVGFDLTTAQLYWLTAVPGLAGGLFRMVYMFLPPVVGTRTLVGGTATLVLLPMLGWAFAVRDASTPYSVLMLLAVAAGIGGGAFSGFMPSTSYFFPKRMAGTALGLQAGIGNFGVS